MDRRNKLTIALLSTAHFALDSYSSFLFQLLPLMAAKLRLTPAQAGLVPPMLTVASSLMQPVYGIISDRYLKRSMVVFGPLIAAVFLSCLGTADSLPGLMGLVILGGVGVGMFHPQGAALVSRAASSDGLDRRQGMMMSVFSSAGTVGYALGPLLVAMAVNRYGLENSWYTGIWGVAFWVVLFRHCPPLEQKGRAKGAPALTDALRAAWVPLTLLYFAVVLRSAVAVSVQTYWPFALKSFGMTEMEYGSVLAGFLFFGGVGGFFGGVLADRLGARRVSMVAMLVAAPLLLAAFSTRGTLSNVLLMAGGTALNLPIPVSVVMAQRLVPGGASTVSALMMGFAWGAGALMTPIAGAMSEKFGFARALMMAALVPLLSAALLWFYPKDGRAPVARAREALAVAVPALRFEISIMGLFWRRKKEEFISLGLSAPDESVEQARIEEAAQVGQVAQWRAESAPVIAEPEVAEPVTAEPETVEPVGIPVEQWAAEAAKLFEPPSHAGAQSATAGAAKPAIEERVVEWVEAPVEEESFFARFRKAVSATRENIASRIEDVVKGKKQIDESTLEELEEALIGADIGVQTTLEIIEDVRRQVSRQTLKDVEELKRVIKERLLEILERAERARGVASEASVGEDARPYVLMVVGVNGTGKTTTIGKLANRIKADGYDVLICAADTFRAAASDQLAIWAERAGVPLIQQKQGTDPAAVLFDSLKAAKARNADVLIVDTAGRLHTKTNLMAELEKMKRVAGREVQGAPHETLLVVDAVTGQNGLSQAREFLKVANVTGLVLTKLDGTAKGGIAVAIAKDLNLPIRYCGIGEKADDLVVFDPKAYVDGLFE